MAITALYVDASAGADTNGGSGEGSAIVDGTRANTAGASPVVDLSINSPDLSGVSVGDSIRIQGQTTGQGNSSDIFEITSVDDGADTVNVTPIPGVGANQPWAIGGAFATIDKAFNVVKAGDKVWIKASATYNENPDIVTAGGAVTEIVFEGYTSSTGDGGQITMTGTITDTLATLIRYCFKNFDIDANGGARAVSIVCSAITWRNCVFKNGTGAGVFAGPLQCFYECEFLDNGGDGADISQRSTFINCKFYRNAVSGVDCSGTVICYNCVFFSNGGAAIKGALITADSLVIAINCTIDGDAKDGDHGIVDSGTLDGNMVAINNIVYDCGAGISNAHGDRSILVYNLVNNCTTPYGGDASDQEGGVSAAPQFVDEAAGADYSLGPTSPARRAGTDYSADAMDMGAIQAEGGGLLVHPGTSGGARG